MQLFKVFFKILNKNKGQLIMYTVIYLSLALLMSNVMKEQAEDEFTGVSLDIALENKDQGRLGAALEQYLGELHKLQELPEGKEALQDAIYYGEIDYVLVIPEDFSEKFAAGDREGLLEGTAVPGSSSSYLAEHDMESFLKTADLYVSAGFALEDAVDLTMEIFGFHSGMAMRPAGREAEQDGGFIMENTKEKSRVEFLNQEDGQPLSEGFYFFQFIPYVFVTMMILGVGVVIKTFQNKDLSARNKCSAVPYLQQSLQILLGCLVYMLGVYAVFMAMAGCNTGGYLFTPQGILSAINALLFAVCALCVSWFAVQFAPNTAVLNAMSNVIGLGFSFLGGVFVSLDVMGDAARKIARFVPSYWYVAANQDIQKVTGFSDAGTVYKSYLMIVMFSLAFFAAGLLANRMKLKSK